MNKHLLCIVSILFLSCSVSEKTRKSNARELIKQEAFCTCIQLSSEQMFKRDTLEGSIASIEDEMDALGVATKNIWRSLDSFTQRFVQLQVSAYKNTVGVHESAIGRPSYLVDCLKFYKSKKLDSLVRSFKQKDYLFKKP